MGPIDNTNGRTAMSLTALMTAALMGQSAFSLAVETPATEKLPDVAYSELASGQADAALRKLEASQATHSDDPATLINLGAAYAAVGRTDRAIATYRAAIASGERYDLQLADGSWMDSRRAARLALRNVLSTHAQAMR